VKLAVVSGLALWAGVTLVLSEVRWFARRPLSDRLRPYALNPVPVRSARGLLSVESFRDVLGPLSRSIGEGLSRVLGVSEDISVRLERIHSPYEATTFRMRQMGGATIALLAGGIVVAVLQPSVLVGTVLLLGTPLLVFLILEQQVSTRSAAWQRSLFLELPVVAEQLAMLLSAGFSLGAAVNRLARRGHGCCARDLRRVTSRIRHGLGDVDALREWAALARVDALDRLVAVLALNSEAADLGRLISDEARSIRKDVQREVVETMEQRSQSVWVPVTVATLVPGVILLAIPFSAALRLFTTG